MRQAGYEVTVVPNQGKGAAKARVEAVRRKFPAMWIHEETCQAGLDALGWYHEKKDDIRGIGLGPDHDWSSHSADAYGLMCIVHEEPQMSSEPIRRGLKGIV
jgi:phage terminase large subunit